MPERTCVQHVQGENWFELALVDIVFSLYLRLRLIARDIMPIFTSVLPSRLILARTRAIDFKVKN